MLFEIDIGLVRSFLTVRLKNGSYQLRSRKACNENLYNAVERIGVGIIGNEVVV
jgi:hypothetical protein